MPHQSYGRQSAASRVRVCAVHLRSGIQSVTPPHVLNFTAVLYTLAKKLAHRVSVPLTLHKSLAPALVRVKARDPFSHKYDSAIPEVALIAVVIIIMKLVYGMDGKLR